MAVANQGMRMGSQELAMCFFSGQFAVLFFSFSARPCKARH